MNPQLILAVALGGAIGSVTRHLISILSGRAFGTDFPWGIFIINVTGSFLIGAFIGLFAAKWDLSQTTRTFLVTGICGGYTTFSSFSLQTLNLLNDGEWFYAGVNIVASVILCLIAVWLGHIAANHLNALKWV